MGSPVLAVDVSNYSDPFTTADVRHWRNLGVGLVIIQAFPRSYAIKYAEQVAQMQACAAAEMPFDAYIYDYLASPDWRAGCLDGLDDANAPHPRRVWLDEEDVSPSAQAMSAEERATAIHVSAAAVATWSVARGLPQGVGFYTGNWWLDGYLPGVIEFSDLPLWLAQYDGVADASVATVTHGWFDVAIKQYQGTSKFGGIGGLDLNVLSDAEVALLPGPSTVIAQAAPAARETPEDWPWPTWYEAAVNYKGIADAIGQQQAAAEATLGKIRELVA